MNTYTFDSLVNICHTCFLSLSLSTCIFISFFSEPFESFRHHIKKKSPLKHSSISLYHHITIITQKFPLDTKTLSKIQSRFGSPPCPPNVLYKLLFILFFLAPGSNQVLQIAFGCHISLVSCN